MELLIRRIGPAAFEAATAEACFVVDGAPAIGGTGSGVRPMEALLASLATCAAMDVVHILRRQRQPLDDLSIAASGQRADATPAPFTAIQLRFTATGRGLSVKKVERAVQLSVEKYCSVRACLRDDITITHQTVVQTD